MKKKILSILLAVLMVVSLLPTAALAGGLDPQFDPCNGSAVTDSSEAPTWEDTDYVFAGWYDARTGGDKVTGAFQGGTPYYAHWLVKADGNTVLTEGLKITADGLFVGTAGTTPLSDTDAAKYGLAYDKDTDTLTMDNAVIDTYDGVTVAEGFSHLYAMSVETALNIQLTGENTVRLAGGSNGRIALETNAGVTVTGEGSLNVETGDADSSSYGVSANSDFTITDSATLTATAGDAAYGSYGVYVNENCTLCNSGTLTATGGAVSGSGGCYSCGVYCCNGLTNDGTITAAGGAASGQSGYSCGVYVYYGDLTNNGTIEATAGESSGKYGTSCGVYVYYDDLTNNGTITATGGAATNTVSYSYGVYCYDGDLTNGADDDATAKIEATSGEAGYSSYGVYSSSGALTNYGTIEAEAGTAGVGGSSCAMTVNGNLTNSGTIKATASYAGSSSYGVYFQDIDNSGTIEAKAGVAVYYSNGVCCNALANSGTIAATAGDATDNLGESCGVLCYGSIENDGTIEAEAGNAYGEYGSSSGVNCGGALTNNGIIEAEAGDAESSSSYGVYCYGNYETGESITNHTGAAIIAAGGRANTSYGVFCVQPVNNKGVFAVTGGEATEESCGIKIENEEDNGSLTVTSPGAVISYGKIETDGGITAGTATVTGASGTFVSGETTSLTQSDDTAPIIIAFGAIFDLCNGQALMTGLDKPTPDPTWGDYDFDGWYTQRTGGEEVTGDYQKGVFYYAHWENAAGNTVLTEGLRIQEEGLFTYSLNDHTSFTLANANDYGLTYDGPTKTLTMDNAVIDTYDGLTGDSTCAALYATSELTVELKGENALYLGKGTGVRAALYIGNSALTLTGGTLIAEVGNVTGSSSNSYGVYCGDFSNQATLKVTAGNADPLCYSKSYGVSCENLTNAGALTAKAGNATGTNSNSYGVSCENLNNSGILKATGGESNTDSYGVSCGELTNEGMLIAEAGKAKSNSNGMSCLTLENKADATLTATAGESTGESGNSFGVSCTNLTNAGTLEATGKESKGFSCGVCSYVNLTNTSKGTLKAWGGEVTGEFGHSFGVYCVDITNDGTLKAWGGEGCNSYGVYSEESTSFTNTSTLTATGGAATLQSSGMFFAGVSLTNTNTGILDATGGEVIGTGGVSSGIMFMGMSLTNEGTLNATGGKVIGGENSTSFGIQYAGSESLTNNGTMTVTADEAYSGSCALFCTAPLTNGTATNASATITAIASDSAAGSIGIYCNSQPLENYGTLTAETGNGGQTYGVQCMNEIKNHGTMKITAGDASVTSYGLLCTGDLTNGTEEHPAATLTAKAGSAAGVDGSSTGVSSAMGLISNYGTLTGTGGDANALSFGVSGTSTEVGIINNGTLTGRSGAAATKSLGVAVQFKDLTVEGGAVISYGGIETMLGGNIYASGAVVTGSNEDMTFESGVTTSLTQKDTTTPTPIIITLGALFDPCNGDPLIASLTAPDPAPTWTGHSFEGWYTAKTGGEKVTSGFVAGTTYYGHWTEKTATLTYNANGHGTAPDSVTMTYAAAVNAAAAITATGYTFTGWNTESNGTGTAYAAGAVVKAANTDPIATTLYAQWTALQTGHPE